MIRRGLALTLLGALLWGFVLPASAQADAVDEAFVRGHDAAQRGDWGTARDAYEDAVALLPGRNALLAYNLGTAYAHLGDWGRATYHLMRATDFRGGPTAGVLESARENLDVVRHKIELQAATEGTIVDRSATSWDLVVEALQAPILGWLTLAAGWLWLLVAAWGQRQRLGLRSHSSRGQGGVAGAVLVLLGFVYAVPGTLHGWALRADETTPEAIVLDPSTEAREGPGPHREVEFRIQGGSRVRIVARGSGWIRVRLPGGLEGWVPERTVGSLDSVSSVPPPPT